MANAAVTEQDGDATLGSSYSEGYDVEDVISVFWDIENWCYDFTIKWVDVPYSDEPFRESSLNPDVPDSYRSLLENIEYREDAPPYPRLDRTQYYVQWAVKHDPKQVRRAEIDARAFWDEQLTKLPSKLPPGIPREPDSEDLLVLRSPPCGLLLPILATESQSHDEESRRLTPLFANSVICEDQEFPSFDTSSYTDENPTAVPAEVHTNEHLQQNWAESHLKSMQAA